VAAGEAAVTAADSGKSRDMRVLVHEFRNLMAVVINYCELIVDETSDPEAVKADISEIRTAAERALVLIDELPRPPEKPTPSEAHSKPG
jgi:signal transduction histidine kinase